MSNVTLQRPLVFIGFMGSGKTTVGRLVAKKLKRTFIDIDLEIETDAGCTIADLFVSEGEEAFRKLETSQLRKALSSPCPTVISCGGGVVLREENRVLMHQYATVVYLKVKAAHALARIDDVASRPLLTTAQSTDAIFALMQSRVALYETCADISVKTDEFTAIQVAAKVVHMLRPSDN